MRRREAEVDRLDGRIEESVIFLWWVGEASFHRRGIAFSRRNCKRFLMIREIAAFLRRKPSRSGATIGRQTSRASMGDLELSESFHRLADEWRSRQSHSSSAVELAMDPAYLQIIGLGYRVVPLILRELEREPDHWFVALQSLTGLNPAPPSARGDLQKMREAWIEWGAKEGHLR